jgi:hypothetical protein
VSSGGLEGGNPLPGVQGPAPREKLFSTSGNVSHI